MTRRQSNKLHLALAWVVSVVVHTLLVVVLYEAYMEFSMAPSPLALLVRDPTLQEFAPDPIALGSSERPQGPEPSNQIVRRVATSSAALPRRATSLEELLLLDRPESAPRPRDVAEDATLPAMNVELPPAAAGATVDVPAPTDIRPIGLPLPRTTRAASPLDWGVLRIASRAREVPRHAFPGPVDGPAATRGLPAPRRRRPTAAFVHRVDRSTPERSAVVERGLEFLARVQLDDGRWRFDDLRGLVPPDSEPVNLRADAAATGLALLAFLGAGYDHYGGRFAWVVDDALRYLVRVQQHDGLLFPECGVPASQVARFYGHGIATLALCEAYGMTGDETLREPAQRAIDYLAATQHPDRGGWRYAPGVNADLSVTGWQVMALRSGELAGLTVDDGVLERAAACVESCRDAESGFLYRYNPWAPESDPLTRHGQRPSTVMTAVGLVTQFHLGADPDDSSSRLAIDHLRANLPRQGLSAATGTLSNPERDTYYWYYATQATYYAGGATWDEWSAALEPLLASSQVRTGQLAGSWDPYRPVSDKWANYGGRVYVTALNLLSLEIGRRHLPLERRPEERVAERPQ